MNKDVRCGYMELLVSLIINSVACVINCGLLTYILVTNVYKKK